MSFAVVEVEVVGNRLLADPPLSALMISAVARIHEAFDPSIGYLLVAPFAGDTESIAIAVTVTCGRQLAQAIVARLQKEWVDGDDSLAWRHLVIGVFFDAGPGAAPPEGQAFLWRDRAKRPDIP